MPPAAIPTVSQRILDLSIRHKIGLAGYEAWVTRKVIGLLNATDADLERRISIALERTATQDTVKRLQALRKEVVAVNREAYSRLGYFLTKEMRDLAEEEAEHLADLVESVVPFKFSATRPSRQLLRTLVTEDPFQGRLLAAKSKDGVHSHIENIAGNRAAALLQELKLGVVQGESWGQILTRIRGTRAGGYQDGVLHTVGRRQAEVLARTAVQHFTEAARDRLIQENADLFQGVMWINTLDLRTCPLCQARGGLVWTLDYRPLGHDLPWLDGPGRIHFLDRCTSVPVLRDVPELRRVVDIDNLDPAQRAALDNPVPITTDYEDWLRTQDEKFQAIALESVARARAFREGKPLEKVWDMRFDNRTPAPRVRNRVGR